MKYLIFTYWKSKKLHSWRPCTGQLKMSLHLWKMLQTSNTCESNNSLYRLNIKGYDPYMDVVQWQMLLLLYLLFLLKSEQINKWIHSICLFATCHGTHAIIFLSALILWDSAETGKALPSTSTVKWISATYKDNLPVLLPFLMT